LQNRFLQFCVTNLQKIATSYIQLARAAGANRFQGYFFGKPAPLETPKGIEAPARRAL